MYKIRKLAVIFLVLTLAQTTRVTGNDSNTEHSTKFVIGCWHAGFFSSFFAVINNIYWCEKHGKTPVVYWGTNSPYYHEEGHNGNNDNVWEYYFEQVSELTYSKEDPIVARYTTPDDSLISTFHVKQYEKLFDKAYRKKVNELLKKYITIKPQVQNKINEFYESYMKNHNIIGIHFRGTDKYQEVAPISVEKMCNTVNEATKNIENPIFLVCTDEEKILNEMKQRLHGEIIYYDAYRSKNGGALHVASNNHHYNKAKLGEEVLVEVSLLSKCDIFFHTCSNVSSAAAFFNPELDNRLLLPGIEEAITN